MRDKLSWRCPPKIRNTLTLILLGAGFVGCSGAAEFPRKWVAYEGHFTGLQIEAIQASFRAWEPAIDEASGTSGFEFEFNGFTKADVDAFDSLHIIRRSADVLPPELAQAHLFFSKKDGSTGSFVPAGDIRMREDIFKTENAITSANYQLQDISCFQAIITHEIGHLIGLNHSENREDVMYPYQKQSQCTNYGVSVGDREALIKFFDKHGEEIEI